MTPDDKFIGSLEAYLNEHEGMTPLPDPVRDAVRAQLPMTKQLGRFSGPMRRFPLMNNTIVRFGLAAAAIVLVVLVGIRFLPGGVGSDATPTPEPSVAAPTPSEPAPSASIDTGFVLWNAPGELAITVTIPASGWSGDVGGGILEKSPGSDPPDGAGMIMFVEQLYVYGDPCHWESTRPATPATTVDELVAALAAQPSRDASDPVDVTVGGYAGKSITLHVPGDAAYSAGEFTDCDQGNFGSFGSDAEPGPARYAQGPGQIDELWILDVGGVLVTIDTAYYAGTPTGNVEELRAIVESATFELP